MRWQVVLGLAILAAVVLTVGAPSALVARQMTAAVRAHVEPGGSVRVRVRATAWGLVQQRLDRVQIEARGIRLGDLVADHLSAELVGVRFTRQPEGWTPSRVQSGEAMAGIGGARLERFLLERGLEQPRVVVEPSGVTVEAAMPAGAVRVPFRLRGRFEAAGRDLRFRATSLEVSGTELPQPLADTLVGLAQPVISLSRLPIPMVVDRVATEPGRVVVRARAAEDAP
jgi:hypothetical protein